MLFNTYAAVTAKTVQANNCQLMTKALRKAIMTRSRLKNVYLKTQNSKNWETKTFLNKKNNISVI